VTVNLTDDAGGHASHALNFGSSAEFVGKLKRVWPGFSPSAARFDGVDRNNRPADPRVERLFTGIPVHRANGTGGGREYVVRPHGIYRVPSGRKRTGYGKEMELGAFANITETTANKGFGEVHNGHSSQKSPTNSPDGA